MTAISRAIDRSSSSEAKIALFRSLFRGRDDVYPRRFESRRTGRSGYAPACVNEWVREVCEKPRIKCADCPNRGSLPVTDEVIRWHPSGTDDLALWLRISAARSISAATPISRRTRTPERHARRCSSF
jgi:hypothetical protein